MTFEEDAEFLFQRAIIEAIEDLIDLLIGRYLLEFYGFESLEDAGIDHDELAHGVEGIVDADGHFNGYVGMKDS